MSLNLEPEVETDRGANLVAPEMVRAVSGNANQTKYGAASIPLERIVRRCGNIASAVERLAGPGAAAVRSASRQLLLAIDLYEQRQRRLAAETLRS